MKLARSHVRHSAPRPFLRHRTTAFGRLLQRLGDLLHRRSRPPRPRVIRLARSKGLVLHERGS